MRPRILLNVLSALVSLIGLSMLPALVLALVDGIEHALGIAAAMTLTTLVGVTTWALTRGKQRQEVNHREGFAIVSIGWEMVCLFGALPHLGFSHLSGACDQLAAQGSAAAPAGWEFCSVSNAVFESASGFTTTGSTILTGGLWESPGARGDGPPRAIPLGRSLSHWLGGMGILLIAVAVLPPLGVGGMQFMPDGADLQLLHDPRPAGVVHGHRALRSGLLATPGRAFPALGMLTIRASDPTTRGHAGCRVP